MHKVESSIIEKPLDLSWIATRFSRPAMSSMSHFSKLVDEVSKNIDRIFQRELIAALLLHFPNVDTPTVQSFSHRINQSTETMLINFHSASLMIFELCSPTLDTTDDGIEEYNHWSDSFSFSWICSGRGIELQFSINGVQYFNYCFWSLLLIIFNGISTFQNGIEQYHLRVKWRRALLHFFTFSLSSLW